MNAGARTGVVRSYHEGTKHRFDRFARSLGYLDWAAQPRPFRHFAGSAVTPLFPKPGVGELDIPPQPYSSLFASSHASPAGDAPSGLPLALPALGFLLRHALGLSAWKGYGGSRWSLRVNPSSGNLHPTEAYVVGPGTVWHYAPEIHALEERCCFDLPAALSGARWPGFVVVLTSIHWREAWKYGERAFRYCQHDIGHAIAALRFAAVLCGWSVRLCDEWAHEDLSAITGIDRDLDFADAEREEPACALLAGPVHTGAPRPSTVADGLVDAIRRGQWTGSATQLSVDHVEWTFIDEVAQATRAGAGEFGRAVYDVREAAPPGGMAETTIDADPGAATIILQRRSAVAFDGMSSMSRDRLLSMLDRLMPTASAPWDTLWWTARTHLLLFVHRVTGLMPGLYVLPRSRDGESLLRNALGREFEWEPVDGPVPLARLASGDCRRMAQRVSCDQEIAADGAFSLGMLVDFDGALDEHGPAFYRRLFWECGVIGQTLYLEAEAAGLRGTGIGCFYDDGVHDLLALRGTTLQSLYHFTVGMPVEDLRLTTDRGYSWEDELRSPIA
ncbi:MAG: SagB/ThcOx family dehydrogenase [Vicinamibacterales bacterium]